ncbi:Sodium channel protein type 7 subunit alpha [Dissostichus eleginoides]|uniref:Sodium channel protein type 7 subunit alpha n=1 Tax=Dissostichus eleginoides TaxID=100907 RepID=A0AAD9F720_DISEL|nr:Sodium channel protein type 7 subunit alpha [Dissostichus eleginoides]
MPRKYKRKTDRVSTPLEELERAVKEVQQGKTICQKKTAVYSSSEESSTTNDEAEDGLEKTHSREKERAEKKKRSGNKKGALKGSKPTKPKKKVLSSSSEESDFPIPFSDATHYESSDVQSDDDDGDKDLSAGDFVIVKFACKKSKSYNYVGLVENVEERMMKESSLEVMCSRTTPQKLGGTARREYKFTFPCSIDKWDVQ